MPPIGRPAVAWNDSLDADVYASPLIVGGHVIVATENNTVYSLDVAHGDVIWTRHLGDPVAASTLPCGDIRPITGITGTPAADATAGQIYVVAFLRGFQHVLFTLSLDDGSVIAQRVVDPPGSDPRVQQERAALAIGSGYVYVAFGGLFGDCGSYHGYVVGVPLAGGAFNVYRTPGTRSGIWAPAGPALAADGSVYVVTGNGSSTSTFDYGDTVIQLTPALEVVGYFAPTNWRALTAGDVDLGSAGVALMGDGKAFVVGKAGVGYLLRAGSLGGIGGQVTDGRVCGAAFGAMAWSGSTVFVPCSDGLIAVAVSTQSFSVAWRASSVTFGPPILAAGAVWAIDRSSATLYALDPTSGAVRYSTPLGTTNHFTTPSATEGFVVAPAGSHVIAVATS